MPGDNDTDDLLEGEETEETEESTEESIEETEGSTEDADKSTKRISDLQSKADKAEARANKAEAALKALNAGKGEDAGTDPATKALMAEVRESALDAVFGENPILKQYGIDRSLIEGGTRAEVRAAAAEVVGLIKSVSTKVRNEVLAEHGLKAEPAGSTRKPPADYSSMSEADFEKLLDSIS